MTDEKLTRRNTIVAAAALGVAEVTPAVAQMAGQSKGKPDLLAAVKGVIADWTAKNIDGVIARLADDIEWHTIVGQPPLIGKPAARAFLEKFGAAIAEVRWRIFDASVFEDRIMVEGVDEYTTTSRGLVVVPYMGVMQFKGDLIWRWRDYADTGLAGKLKNGEPVPDYVKALTSRKAL